jgi:hypothetical protein
VPGFDHPDVLRRQAVAVARDGEAFHAAPGALDGQRHRSRRLACGGDEDAPARTRGEVLREDDERVGGRHRGAETLL